MTTMMTTSSPVRTRATMLAALAAILVFALPATTFAKDKKPEPYALIFGTVFGPDMLPVQGVTIKIKRSDQKKAKWQLLSDRRGEFAQRLPAGKAEYQIVVEVPKNMGLRPDKPSYSVQVDNDERQDIAVHLK